MEILQGARNDSDYQKLRAFLTTQAVAYFPPEKTAYEQAARIYYSLRRKGVTIRSTIDVMIAQTAMQKGWLLLHNDRDFDQIASHFTQLCFLESIHTKE